MLYGLAVRSWSFTIEEQPETCIGVNLAFSGGTPPYTITFLHVPDVSPGEVGNLSSWASGAAQPFIFHQTYPASAGGVGVPSSVGFTPLVIVGSDATGFGTGGTSQTVVVEAMAPPLLPGCSIYPTNNTAYLSYLQSFSTSITECGDVTAKLNASLPAGVLVDTIVPLGQSYRTVVNVTATNGTISWPVTVTAGTNVSFAFTDPRNLEEAMFVTPLITVQPGNTTCQASGTISAPPTALPTFGPAQSTGAGECEEVGGALLAGIAAAASVAMVGMLGL